VTLAIVEAAAAVQEPLEADAIARDGAWAPRSIRDVEWALECIAESKAEVADIDAQLEDLITRAKARAEKIKGPAQNRIAFFSGRVAEFAEGHKGDLLVGKKKSRDFLSGRIGWRKKGGKLVVADKAALADWLSTQDPALYRVEVKPEMKALQELAATQGIIPPGCDFEPERDEVYVEAAPLPTLNAVPRKELP
jgi:phage host-nuclease inhibitor protein Gam